MAVPELPRFLGSEWKNPWSLPLHYWGLNHLKPLFPVSAFPQNHPLSVIESLSYKYIRIVSPLRHPLTTSSSVLVSSDQFHVLSYMLIYFYGKSRSSLQFRCLVLRPFLHRWCGGPSCGMPKRLAAESMMRRLACHDGARQRPTFGLQLGLQVHIPYMKHLGSVCM
jgi:hypothetical protein